MTIDLLAFGAHPDDCELFAGGMLASLSRQGRRIVLCDLTRGEAATRGTPEERAESADKAAAILGVQDRIRLDLGDGGLENTPEARRTVVELLRRLRPKAVLTHHPEDRHPDHGRAHRLVRECVFYATIGGLSAAGERLDSPPHLFYFFGNAPVGKFQPDFIVPIDEIGYQARLQAVRAYASQFFADRDDEGPKTLISSEAYAQAMEARYRYFGAAVGAQFGEPYALEKPPAVRDPLESFRWTP